MPKRLADEPTVVAIAKLPESLDARVVKFWRDEGLPNKSAAMRVLLERGLTPNGVARKPKRARPAGGGCAHPVGRRIADMCMECGGSV